MKRPVLFAALVAHLFVMGCTGAPKQSPLLGPNDNPDELAAAIIRRGQGEGPPPPKRPDQDELDPVQIASSCVLLAEMAGVGVLLGAGAVLYVVLRTWPALPNFLTNTKHH